MFNTNTDFYKLKNKETIEQKYRKYKNLLIDLFRDNKVILRAPKNDSEIVKKEIKNIKLDIEESDVKDLINRICELDNTYPLTSFKNNCVNHCYKNKRFNVEKLLDYFSNNYYKLQDIENRKDSSIAKPKIKSMTSKLKSTLDDLTNQYKHHNTRSNTDPNNSYTDYLQANDYQKLQRMIDQWLVLDIKNAGKREVKSSFIDAVEIINDDREHSRLGEDLRFRSAQRLKEYKKNKEAKFQKDTDHLIKHVPNGQDAFYLQYLMHYSDDRKNIADCLYSDKALMKIKADQTVKPTLKDKLLRPRSRYRSMNNEKSQMINESRETIDYFSKRSDYLINELSVSELRGYI